MHVQLQLVRDSYSNKSTLGKLYIQGDFFCHTLEDVVRPYGEKEHGETAIPNGLYQVNVSRSGRFKRYMPILFNQPNGYELRSNGISFSGIRLHSGNTHKDTHGCPLVAYNRISENMIQGTAEKELIAKIKDLLDQFGEVFITVTQKAESNPS